MVDLEVLSSGAIYINNTRITNRSTKPWGGSGTVFSAKVAVADVIATLKENNINISKIDPEYARQQGVILDT